MGYLLISDPRQKATYVSQGLLCVLLYMGKSSSRDMDETEEVPQSRNNLGYYC